jgi:hypothetical protein
MWLKISQIISQKDNSNINPIQPYNIKSLGSRILLLGGVNTGKTSIAFNLAYHLASQGGHPLFLCHKNKISSKFPLIIKSERTNTNIIDDDNCHFLPSILSCIQIKYISSFKELKEVMASIHCYFPIPTSIIIDDLSKSLDPLYSVPKSDNNFLRQVMIICAMTKDAIEYIDNRKSNTNNDEIPSLLITDECFELQFIKVILNTILKHILTINKDSSDLNSAYRCNYRKNPLYESEDDVVISNSIVLHNGVLHSYI